MNVIDLLPRGTWSPASVDAEKQIAVAEGRSGHSLPEDLRELHRRCTNISLLGGRYTFLPPEAMRPIAERRSRSSEPDR